MISLDEAKARIEDFLIKTFPSRPMDYNYELNKYGWIFNYFDSRATDENVDFEEYILFGLRPAFISELTGETFFLSVYYDTDYEEDDFKDLLSSGKLAIKYLNKGEVWKQDDVEKILKNIFKENFKTSSSILYKISENKFGWIITYYSRKNCNKFKIKNENPIFIEKETLNFFEISKNYRTDYIEEDFENLKNSKKFKIPINTISEKITKKEAIQLINKLIESTEIPKSSISYHCLENNYGWIFNFYCPEKYCKDPLCMTQTFISKRTKTVYEVTESKTEADFIDY